MDLPRSGGNWLRAIFLGSSASGVLRSHKVHVSIVKKEHDLENNLQIYCLAKKEPYSPKK